MDDVADIIAAYWQLAAQPGQWIPLAAIQNRTGIGGPAWTKAIATLAGYDDVRVEPEPLCYRITADDRSAAVEIGGEDRHWLAII